MPSIQELEYRQYDCTYDFEEEWRGMIDVREQAVRFALSELARENITPDVDLDAPLPLIEMELTEMVALYSGRESAEETKRLFVNASLV